MLPTALARPSAMYQDLADGLARRLGIAQNRLFLLHWANSGGFDLAEPLYIFPALFWLYLPFVHYRWRVCSGLTAGQNKPCRPLVASLIIFAADKSNHERSDAASATHPIRNPAGKPECIDISRHGSHTTLLVGQ